MLRAFRYFDADGDGGITCDEIMAGLRGQGVRQAEAEELLREWDTDKNGSIR